MSEDTNNKKPARKPRTTAKERIAKLEERAKDMHKIEQQAKKEASQDKRKLQKLERQVEALETEETLTEANLKLVASLQALGGNSNTISKQTGLSRGMVKYIMSKEECQTEVESIGDAAVANAKRILKNRMAGLSDLWYEGLKSQLKKKNIQALTLYAKMIGVDSESENSSGNLTVILPTAPSQASPGTTIVLPTKKSEEK